MTATILKKMKEKEKKPDKKGGEEKGLRRNKTTANFNRSKLDKSIKGDDNKSKKSVGGKKSGGDKKDKPTSTSVKTEVNEKKKTLAKSGSKRDVLSQTAKKPFNKSQTLANLTVKKKSWTYSYKKR